MPILVTSHLLSLSIRIPFRDFFGILTLLTSVVFSLVINSFDQWGVALGKKLAVDVKKHIMSRRANSETSVEIKNNPATSRILNYHILSRVLAVLTRYATTSYVLQM